MKTCFPSVLSRFLSGLAFFAAAIALPLARADIPAGNALYTVGTTYTSDGKSHVYVLWMSTKDDLLRLRSYSVWSKAGAADSPAEYQPESWVKVQTDPAVIEAALRRAERLGQDLSKLEVAIDGLFDIFKPGESMSRSEKLSVIMQGALVDSRLYHDLLVLARLHPSISLCLGAAYTGPANGLRTYEVRMAGLDDRPLAPDAVRRVVGRVTLDPGAYQPLPAPGRPIPVPFGKWKDGTFQRDARGNLNARMRWATPDPLRQQSLLQFGYRVYRVDPAFYQSAGMGGPGVRAGDLAAYAEAFPDEVTRVSRTPVLIERMLTAAEAADQVGDSETSFFIDDNRRFDPGGVPFNDGDEFQYMVTAVDVLGRDGMPSPATLFQICRTVGPNPPRNLTVRDQVTHPTTTTTRQVFGLSWQAPATITEAPVNRFDIYRWVDADDPVTSEDPTNPDDWSPGIKVGSVPAEAGREWYAFEDSSLGVPPPAAELNKPWWFTVCAVSTSACGDLPSPHGAPASGVLRDRSSPPTPTVGSVTIKEGSPVMTVDSTDASEPLPTSDSGFLNARITLNRTSNAIDGADFYYRLDNAGESGTGEATPLGPAPVDSHYLGSVRFKTSDDPQRITNYRIPMPDAGVHRATFHLRARDIHGNLSDFDLGTLSSAPDDQRKIIVATASHAYDDVTIHGGFSNAKHISRPADQDTIATPTLQFEISPDTHTWKIYRRIDLGPLVLVKEASGAPPASVETEPLSVNAGEVSYHLQLIDPSGNASGMFELGHFSMTAVEPPPQAMLLPVEAMPEQTATLSWACAPHGVVRYHVGVAAVGKQASDRISTQLSSAFELRADVPVEIGGQIVDLDFRMYDTGPLLNNTSPEHSVTLNLEADLTYYFIVEAVTSCGEKGKASNMVSFAWLEPVDGGPDAVWPARPSPPINEAFATPRATPQGIEIGNLPEGTTATPMDDTVLLFPPLNLQDQLFTETSGEREDARSQRKLLPCVVYRYQIPNQTFPKVSGNVSQVTPLLRDIAARDEYIFRKDQTVVYDPYFKFDTARKKILLYVPQPTILNASYRYLLVLFGADGEIDSVVPTTTFTSEIN